MVSGPCPGPAGVPPPPERVDGGTVAAAAEDAEARSSGDHTICESTFCSGCGRSPMLTSILNNKVLVNEVNRDNYQAKTVPKVFDRTILGDGRDGIAEPVGFHLSLQCVN